MHLAELQEALTRILDASHYMIHKNDIIDIGDGFRRRMFQTKCVGDNFWMLVTD